VNLRSSASQQRPARDGDAQPDEDGEPEHGVGCARTQVERDPGSDHRNRESDIERDEQVRRHRDAAFRRAGLEHDPGGPLEDSTRTRADQRTQHTAYPLWDISLSRNTGRLRPYLRLLNLSNTGYQEIPQVVMQGRTIIAGTQFTWSRASH